MRVTLGFDTSCYTTSAAAVNEQGEVVAASRMLLPVKQGERGLRQSEAVFAHVRQMPLVMNELKEQLDGQQAEVVAVCASSAPRDEEDSYMPVFTVGLGHARVLADVLGVPLFETSHQQGHVAAGLIGHQKPEEAFVALHLSGGTTELLLVKPDKDAIIRAEMVAESTDLKAGQAIDRAGVMLGLPFPCGKALDTLAQNATQSYKVKPSMKGCSCSLSGVENKAKSLFEQGERPENIAKFVLTSVCVSIEAMLDAVAEEYGSLPVIFSGGVSSNTMLRSRFAGREDVFFASPEFSLDNAAGCAVYAYLKENKDADFNCFTD